MNSRVNAKWLAGGPIVLIAFGTAFAQTSLNIGNSPGYPGATVPVSVSVRKATNLVAAQFDFSYDPAKTVPGAPALGIPNAGYTIRSREISPGVRRTVVYSMNNGILRTNGFNATVPFQTPPGERIGSGPITPNSIILAKRDGTSIAPVTASGGAVFVREVNRLPDGTVQFFLPSTADERYVIQATTDFERWVNLTNTTASGNFMDFLDRDAQNYPQRFYRWLLADAAGEFGTPALNVDGSVGFRLSGLDGRSYVLQASANLVDWTSIRTNVATGGSIEFNFPVEAGFPHRFFRVQSR